MGAHFFRSKKMGSMPTSWRRLAATCGALRTHSIARCPALHEPWHDADEIGRDAVDRAVGVADVV